MEVLGLGAPLVDAAGLTVPVEVFLLGAPLVEAVGLAVLPPAVEVLRLGVWLLDAVAVEGAELEPPSISPP